MMLLVAVATLVACEQKPQTDEIRFPEAVVIECEAGDTPSISFNATAAWQLSSNAIWCNFYTPAGKLQDMSGAIGNHTIMLNISTEGLKDKTTEATITMKMGGRTATIATVRRAAERLTLNIYTPEGEPIEAIELGYNEYIPFEVEANFRFAATDFPEWVEFEGGAVTGGAGERIMSGARIANDGSRERYAIAASEGHTITFSNESGTADFSFAITYKGMGEDALTFTGPSGSSYGWEVTLEGDSFRQYNELTDEYLTFDDALPFTITAQDDNYAVVCFEQVVECGLPRYTTDAAWITFDKSSMSLRVDATDKERYGAVMVLPMGIYDDIKADLHGNLVERDYSSGVGIEVFRYDFLKYVIVEFTQHSFAERDPYEGFYVYHSLTTYEIPCERLINDALAAEYGVTELYTCPFPIETDGKSPNIIIDPRIEEWTTATFEEGRATAEFYYRGELLKASEGEFEMGENKDEVMAVRLVGPAEGFEEEVYALFKLDGEPKKLLVVTPPAK